MDVLYSIFGVFVFLLVAYLCYMRIVTPSSVTININKTDTTQLPAYDFSSNSVTDVSNNRVFTKTKKKGNTPYVTIGKGESPYVTTPINSLDDYEYNAVFNNETDQELSAVLKNKLTSQYPMEWSNQPTNVIREGFDSQVVNPYSPIVDDSMKPPDTLAIEKAERDILQTYQPKHAGDLSTYDVDDAMQLIKKIYDKKNEIPTIVKKENNVYEIVGTRKKDEKIVYDEMDTDGSASAPPPQVQRPMAAADKQAALDPFFAPASADVQGQAWNFNRSVPGLQRPFAPTEPIKNWY